MSRIARRLASTAATASTSASRAARTLDYVPPTAVSTAHIRFPPPAAQRGEFDANTWARLQPPPPAALHALAARVGLAGVLADDAPAALLAACTHPSFVEYWRTNARGTERATGTPADNANLAATGNALLGLFASEWLHASFPHLPTRVLKAAVSAYVGPLTCASVAKEMGVAPLLRWHRVVRSFSSPV
jgi:large subunit ribosomal protein L44